jgi:hypothetical protein
MKQVITAAYEGQDVFASVDYVRCNRVLPPWRVDNTACYRINLQESTSQSPASPMNDPGLKGTADSMWGAQCGRGGAAIEALTAVKLVQSNKVHLHDNIECCALYRTDTSLL